MVQYPQTFNLFDYFEGPVKATGVFQDPFHCCRRKLVVDLFGSRHENQLKLDELFHYDDGEKQERVWWLSAIDENQFQGHADDVIGLAKGSVNGAELRWRYQMLLPIGNWKLKVSFDDRMYLLPDNILINRATIRKWGIPIGTVTLVFQREPTSQNAA